LPILALLGVLAMALPVHHPLQAASSPSSSALDADAFLTLGTQAFAHGQFEAAIEHWTRAAEAPEATSTPAMQIQALIYRGETHQALGRYQTALQDLHQALARAEAMADPELVAASAGSLGNAYFRSGATAEAQRYLETSIAQAAKCSCPDIAALGLNHLGNALTSQGHYREAMARYRESIAGAEQAGNQALLAKALSNAARAALADGQPAEAQRLLERALTQTRRLEASHDKSYLLMAVGRLLQRMPGQSAEERARQSLAAYQVLWEGKQIAQALDDRRAASYALGYLGELYEREQRYPEALRLTQEALFRAQEANAPELQYRWHWQSGRLHRAQGDIEGAIASYRRSVSTLQSVRPDLMAGPAELSRSFQTQMKPVFYELVELLLDRASAVTDEGRQAQYLAEARETVETFKAAELQDYFQDDCVVAAQARSQPLDRVAPRTAVLYPILFPDRIEWLLATSGRLQRFTSRIALDVLSAKVQRFRESLLRPRGQRYLRDAQRLYDWLIRPLEGALKAQADTLVFVPDGPLRTIPIAALHDGKEFLIQRYALVITPGLRLTDARPFRAEQAPALLGGLSEAVQGYPALPKVRAELAAIERLYPAKRLLDEAFVISKLQREMENNAYALVHIATHARFERDVRHSFLLTYDGRLSMSELEELVSMSQYRKQPVELLSLSACETALGDERAALGLAGVAVKAGARSAIATLWKVSDEATARLLPEFYRQLQSPSVANKAEALRNAQLALMRDRRFQHPGVWSPFLLIGNWL
jgi:CHAT domain-containing protein